MVAGKFEEMDYTVQSWEDFAREKQQEWYEVFGDRDWDKYNINSDSLEKGCFMQNIGHAIYGLPDEEPCDKNCNTGYSEDKLKHIQQMCDIIIKHHKNTSDIDDQHVLIGIIYVYMKIDFEDSSHIPTVVFRVMKEDAKNGGSNIFVDADCRVYVGWVDYLENNKLPKCTYCYPCNGVYYGDECDQVLVDVGVTPAGKLVNKVLNGIDIAGTVVAVGSTVVTAAAAACTAPILMATAVSVGYVVGGYGVGRCVENIVDRKKHGQSIGLQDSNARSTWLSLAANVVGMAAAGATKLTSALARSGNVVGKTGQFAVNATQVCSITFNGVNIVNTIFVLRQKCKTNSVTSLDIFQFSTSILFFSNSVINFKLAQTIIQESQQSTIKDFEAKLRSNRHMKAFGRLLRNTRKGLDPMHGNAKVIRGINKISNPADFFSGVVRVQKQFGQNKADVSFADSGHIAINKDLIVDPFKFAGIEKSQRHTVLEASRLLGEGSINRSQYEAIVTPVLDKHGLLTLNTQSTSKVCSAFGVRALNNVKMYGKSILANIGPAEYTILMRITAKIISPHIVPTAIKVAEFLKLDKVVDFLKFLEYFNDYVKQLLMEMEDAYMDLLNIAKRWDNFNQDQFDLDNGIEEDRQKQFLNIILKVCSVGKKIIEIGHAFEEYLLEKHHHE